MCRLSSASPSGPTTKRPQLATFAVLQAHGTSKHQAPSTWHAACLPRGETRCPHRAEYWQAGGPLSSSGHATEFAECVSRSKFPPPHMYLVVAGQWNFMVYRCDQIGSAYNAALSTLSYLVRARLGNPTLSGISCRAKTWTWWSRCTLHRMIDVLPNCNAEAIAYSTKFPSSILHPLKHALTPITPATYVPEM